MELRSLHPLWTTEIRNVKSGRVEIKIDVDDDGGGIADLRAPHTSPGPVRYEIFSRMKKRKVNQAVSFFSWHKIPARSSANWPLRSRRRVEQSNSRLVYIGNAFQYHSRPVIEKNARLVFFNRPLR